MTVNILAVGDVVGKTGLAMLSEQLRGVKKYKNIAFTVVNGENADNLGILPAQAEEIFAAGADVITLGNHTWSRRDIKPYLDDCAYILRPANYAPQVPGRGWGVFDSSFGSVAVMNLIGRCDMPFGSENPFFEADKILKQLGCKVILADMHAEATSEKLAMAYYLDGRVSAVWGTHTHVQTSDARVFPNGTGAITDLGMTGACESILGVKPEQSISRFLGNPPTRYEDAGGRAKIEGAIFEIDPETGKCAGAEAIRIE
ncbi:MAG: YmdB family metallophosphoesterase [Oscillospiraceae bacterium]|jgi:metallophosphoesterase (TIGR00282 family)|nr:YmdB family metallophosphoesterase [Oscillospiraceae bacterium]